VLEAAGHVTDRSSIIDATGLGSWTPWCGAADALEAAANGVLPPLR
jgi:hypothetical protein